MKFGDTTESIDAHSNDTQNDEQAHVNDHPMTANEKSTGQPSTNESTHISTADSVRQSSAMFKSSSALSRDGGAAKCKRMRTTFRNSQLKAMRLHFNQNQNPDGLELRRLSARTGLSKRVLQVLLLLSLLFLSLLAPLLGPLLLLNLNIHKYCNNFRAHLN